MRPCVSPVRVLAPPGLACLSIVRPTSPALFLSMSASICSLRLSPFGLGLHLDVASPFVSPSQCSCRCAVPLTQHAPCPLPPLNQPPPSHRSVYSCQPYVSAYPYTLSAAMKPNAVALLEALTLKRRGFVSATTELSSRTAERAGSRGALAFAKTRHPDPKRSETTVSDAPSKSLYSSPFRIFTMIQKKDSSNEETQLPWSPDARAVKGEFRTGASRKQI